MFKRITTRAAFPMLALGLMFGCSPEQEQVSPDATFSADMVNASLAGAVNPAVRLKSNSYIIISSTNSLPANLESQLKALNGNVSALLNEVGIAAVTSADPNFAAKAGKISGVSTVIRDAEVQWLNPENDKTFEADALNTNLPSSADNDPYFFLQWGHTAIKATQAWNAGARGQGVKVAVLDTGFFLEHPDLKGNIISSKSFVTGEVAQFVPKPGKTSSHGSHVAGTIAAADNNIGVVGVAPEAKLILVKVLRDSGSGSFSWMLQGILHAVQEGADVINMSLGAGLPRNGKYLDEEGNVINDTKATQELINAISRVTTYATQKGVTVISSAGNDANNGNADKSLMYIPAGAPNVISISSTAPTGWFNDPLNTNLDGVASYTNYGTPDVTFSAPGGDYSYPTNELSSIGVPVWALDMVLSTGTATGYNWNAGTSMASPHAAGVAALIISKNGGKMDPKKVEAVLRNSSDDLGEPDRDPYYGHGRVNAYRAVSAVQ